MQTLSFKLDRRHVHRLAELARARRCSKAQVVRELIEQQLHEKGRSLHEQAKDLCGCFSGPGNLSTRKLTGYGRD